jgi:hypothetical protein
MSPKAGVFAVPSEIEALRFLFLGDTQPDHEIDDRFDCNE